MHVISEGAGSLSYFNFLKNRKDSSDFSVMCTCKGEKSSCTCQGEVVCGQYYLNGKLMP